MTFSLGAYAAETTQGTSAVNQTFASDWNSEAELGVVSTSGNTDTFSVNGRIGITNERLKWRHNLQLEAYRSESAGLLSAEKYQFSEKTDYKFNQHDYVFLRTNYEDDRFSGFEYQASFSGGYGHRFSKQEKLTIDLEAGPGVRYSKELLMQTDKESFLRIAGKLTWEITKTSRFVHELTSDHGENLTVSKSITTLQASLNSRFAMKLTHTLRHQSSVPIGREKTDRETATTLVYQF